MTQYGNTPGGVAPLPKKHLPQITEATRINPCRDDEEMKMGAAAAWKVADRWLEDFSVKADISPWLFIVGAIGVLMVITATVIADAYKTATGNPVEYLKNE